MFIPGLGENRCARCLLPIDPDGNCIFILSADNGDEARFCYECGIKEQHEHTGEPVEDLDKRWRVYFNMEKAIE